MKFANAVKAYDGADGASNAYTFTIRATDAAGNSSDLDVRIEMEDATPVIMGSRRVMIHRHQCVGRRCGGAVADFGATDTSSVV